MLLDNYLTVKSLSSIWRLLIVSNIGFRDDVADYSRQLARKIGVWIGLIDESGLGFTVTFHGEGFR